MTFPSLSFPSLSFPAPSGSIFVLLVLLGLSAIYSFYRQRAQLPSKPRFLLVLFFGLIAYGCVGILVLNPQTAVPQTTSATVITDKDTGTIAATDFVLSRYDTDLTGGKPLVTADQMLYKKAGLRGLTVRGYGLSAADWASLPSDLTVSWTQPSLSGFTQLSWSKQISLGKSLSVMGNLTIAGSQYTDNYKIELQDFTGRTVDQLRVQSGQLFVLTAQPKVAGLNAYRLIATNRAEEIVAEETLYLHSVAPKTPSLLVLQSSPTFDSRQMMDWARRDGAELLIHSRISKDRFLTQAVSWPSSKSTALTPTLLKSVDLVVMDGREYGMRTGAEQALLQEAVEAGMGMVLLLDSDSIASLDSYPFLAGYSLIADKRTRVTTPAVWPNRQEDGLLRVLPYRLNHPTAEAIVTDEKGMMLVSLERRGLGVLSLTPLRHLYSLALSGNQADFTGFWRHIFDKVGRRQHADGFVPFDNDHIVRVGVKQRLCTAGVEAARQMTLQTPDGQSYQFMAQSTDLLDSPLMCHSVYPQTKGWHLANVGSNQFAFYAYDWDALQAESAATRIQATAAYIALSESQTASAGREKRALAQVQYPMDKFWLWVIFITCCSALWVERKLRQ